MLIVEWFKEVFGSIIEVTGVPIFIAMMLFLFVGLICSCLKVGS